MLNLHLRKEFLGKVLKGTAIELSTLQQSGATQASAADFLEITYPSIDLIAALEAFGAGDGRTIVLMGDRGLGKSHLLAALYHSVKDSDATKKWLAAWTERLGNEELRSVPLNAIGMPVAVSLHKQNFKHLWEPIFANHPRRERYEALFEAEKQEVPSENLILQMLKEQPMILLLDEAQTWFDGLTNTKQLPRKNWAFSFIQMLSEIAKDHPQLLTLVVSVRNGQTDLYEQIHRLSPRIVDFKSKESKRDRRRLLLHRLFENRAHLPSNQIESLIEAHLDEYLRLAQVSPSDQERVRTEFVETWPFAPHLMQVLEDQILVATAAQETRDLIKILAQLYKSHDDKLPILSAADFDITDDLSGIGALLDSVSDPHHSTLRQKAQRNLEATVEALKNKMSCPHLHGILNALWLRSLAAGPTPGATRKELQIDITKDRAIDDNVFEAELETIVNTSFNIHSIGERLLFKEDENPETQLRAESQNDKLFEDREDVRRLMREIRYVIAGQGATVERFHVIVLPFDWHHQPWLELDEVDRPERWDNRLRYIVLPEWPNELEKTLGKFLKDQLTRGRNTLRFLLPRREAGNLFQDRSLMLLSRMVVLADRYKDRSPQFRPMLEKFQKSLRDELRQRYTSFTILRRWSFQNSERCAFDVEQLAVQGSQIPEYVNEQVRANHFVEEDFVKLAELAANTNTTLSNFLRELQEPRPNEEDCIPWLGELIVKEKLGGLCAKGNIALNSRGGELLQADPGETEERAWSRIKGKVVAISGKQLDDTTIIPPQPTAKSQISVGITSTVSRPSEPHDGGRVVPGVTPQVPPAPSNPFAPRTPVQSQGYSVEPTSALNLLASVEKWGVGPATRCNAVTLNITSTNGAQLQKLLKGLPDGLTYGLALQKEEN